MKLDAHQHFWRYNSAEYGWIGEEMTALRRDFLPDDLAREQAQVGFDGSIAVQARQSLAETEWLLALAADHDRIRGVVGWLDLCSQDLPDQLERFAPSPRLRGLRHVLQDEPDDRFMLRDDFRRGLSQLRRWNLAYDLLIYPRHLGLACELAGKLPDQVFLLDHMAKPPVASGELEPWAKGLRALAAFPNIACKASGLVTEADWHNWRAADFLPYLEVAFEAFGPSRIMIGSDWPVCTVGASYEETMGIVLDYILRLSPSEQRLVLGQNTQSWYGLTQ